MYENPLTDTTEFPATSEAGVKASKQADLIPKGKYSAILTDFSSETVKGGPAQGMLRARTTWQIDLGGRRRLHFVDLVPSENPVCWDNGGELRDYTLANQLAEALGMVGKPFGDVLRQAMVQSVNHNIDIDKKTDRNITRKITA